MKYVLKLKRWLSYKFGERDLKFKTELSEYIPDEVFDYNISLYVVGYKKKTDSYTILIKPLSQQKEQ